MPLLTLLGQNAVGVTLGATTQLSGDLTATGGLTLERVLGATADLSGALDATGGITLERVIGGTVSLSGALDSTGTIQVGDVVDTSGGIPPEKRKKAREEEYKKAFFNAKSKKEKRKALQKLKELDPVSTDVKPKLKLKKKQQEVKSLAQKDIERIEKIQSDIDKQLAIEFQLDFNRRERELLSILLLMS